jgi:DNA-binding NtrC family response regulator
LFVLDRRLRLLFGNRAWEAIARMPLAKMRGRTCRRPRPPSAAREWKVILTHAMTPPPEAIEGRPARVRRLLPRRDAQQWWEIDFLPFRHEGKPGSCFLLGRIQVLRVEAAEDTLLPERLVNLRQQAVAHHALDLWTASRAPAVRRLVEQVRLATAVSAPVLLVGESGTGKQSLARAIHYNSAAHERPFIALDCDRLPSAASAAILFVTGQRSGPGAIYLREPGALPRDLQVRLASSLRGAKPGDGPRLMAGSRRSLEAELAAGRLTDELGCLLGTLVLEVPPLRQRLEELPDLIEHVVARTSGEAPAALAADVWAPLKTYAWPGNLRELHRVLASARRRAGNGPITAAHLPGAVRRADKLAGTPGRSARPTPTLDYLLEQSEKHLIELALRRTGGHITKAAQLLGIWRQRLVRRMSALKIAGAEGEASEAPP